MLGTIGMTLLGMVLWQATDAPDISGQWTSDEWGTVILTAKQPGQYEGTFTGSDKGRSGTDELKWSELGAQQFFAESTPGTIQLKWSRVERRFNGTWKAGDDRKGKLSLRLVGNEIRGALTTAKNSDKEPDSPRLADLSWVRPAGKQPEPVPQVRLSDGKTKFDKSALPKVSRDFHTRTTVLNGLVSGGGIIEHIEGDTIHFRSGDRIVVPAGTMLLVPKHGKGPMEIHKSDLLEPGMAIAYSIRDGKIEKPILIGILEQAPGGKSVIDTIKELQLRKGSGTTASSVDGRFPMRITGSDGEVTIKIGETKLIKLPKLTESIEWRVGEFKPDGIEDIEPFDYVLVQWRDNGHLAVTCYASPPADAPKEAEGSRVNDNADREDPPKPLWREYGVTPAPVSDQTAKALESIGLHLTPITKDDFREKSVFAKYSGGLDVTFVRSDNGTAEKAGIHEVDIVVKLQGRIVASLADLDLAMQDAAEQIKRKDADSLQFDILRNGETVRVNVPFPDLAFAMSSNPASEVPKQGVGRIEGQVLRIPKLKPVKLDESQTHLLRKAGDKGPLFDAKTISFPQVTIQSIELHVNGGGMRVFASAKPGEDGKFVFENVPSGLVMLVTVQLHRR